MLSIARRSHESGARQSRKSEHGILSDTRLLAIQIAVLLIATVLFAFFENSYLLTFNAFLLAAMGAMALNLLMGTVGLVSIGNAAFLAAGAFGSIIVMKWGVAFPWDVPLGGVVAALAGLVIGLPAIRLRGLGLGLATLAGFFIITQLAEVYQVHNGGGTAGFLIHTLYESQSINGAQQYWAFTLLGVVILTLIGVTRISRGRSGRAWRLIRDNEIVARGMGVPVTRYKLIAFVLSSGLIGIEGSLTFHFTGSASFDDYTIALAISYLAMVAIGGFDSIFGVVIGAGIVIALPVVAPNVVGLFVSNTQNPSASASYATIIYGALIIVATVSSHGGLAGTTQAQVVNVRRFWSRHVAHSDDEHQIKDPGTG